MRYDDLGFDYEEETTDQALEAFLTYHECSTEDLVYTSNNEKLRMIQNFRLFGIDKQVIELAKEQPVNNTSSLYLTAKNAKIRTEIMCPTCKKLFIKKTYQQVFCCNKGTNNCKDTYWNTAVPSRNTRAKIYKIGYLESLLGV